ncbi:MAG: class I SAM-dependent rRNA methyltransferase [Alistipes sp.]|nr:class I SAM-dependent rRNA methyltransferase [Alistipes sp.]
MKGATILNRACIHLRRGKEESLLRRHPWVFSGAIEHITEGIRPLAEGDIVDVRTKQGDFIAMGHYQIGSIAVRVLSFEEVEIDQEWWNHRIANARMLREAMNLVDNDTTTCYRLIHGEGDLLPGLVVDIYHRTAVVQCHSVGMYLSRQNITEAIRAAYGDSIEAIYDKSSQTLPFKADLGAIDGYLWGRSIEPNSVVFENGLKFKVNWEEGQKTGFFIDQRVNRDLVRQYAKGRKVLNTFCYTGGFSVAALAGGAREVVSIDLSERAVKLADENVRLNFGDDARHEAIACNAVEYLKDIDDSYDLIILDPPAFAKHHKVLGNALQGYKKINARALQKIRPGGILFTFSCSQAVSRELFRTTIFTAAAIAGRKVRIIGQLTQPADHPINIYHPEGEYLKGLVVYVE